ncbi:MAG TPA: hypothetical protein VF316_21325 [Polyangiaceae bacterium]
MKLSRTEIAVIIATLMGVITLNAYFRVRAMGAAARERVEHAAALAALTEAGVEDAGESDVGADASAAP